MKHIRLIVPSNLVLIALTLLAAISARAYTNSFDTASSTNGWVHWWGGARENVFFDPTVDADGNPASGSMQVSVPFSRSLGGDNQFSMWGSFSGIPNSWTARLDGSQYAKLEMDIFWDAFSPIIPSSGNFSSDFHYGFAVGDPVYGQIDFQNHLTIASTEAGQWLHLSMNLDPAALGPNLTNIVGIWFKMWTGNDPNNSLQDGTAVFWVDNIRLQLLPPPPPPTPDYTNTFDVVESINGWAHWWGAASETREFDATKDADGNPASGSMKVTVPYRRANGGDNQFSMWGSFSGNPNSWGVPLNGTLYTNLEMDIYWDPSSPTRPSTGDYGNDFRYGFAVGQPIYGQIAFNNHSTIAAADVGHWFHLSAPIDLATVGQNITNIVGVWIKMWTGSDPNNSLSDGDAIFWVDNIRLRAKATNAPAIPAPTLGAEKPKARGLRLFASAPGSQYQRQGIRTVNNTYSWVSALDPVTYSVTISEHPGVAGFQTHIFLIPGSPAANNTSPDYSEPNVVMLDIGGTFANFRYKTNEPNGNGFLYSGGTIAGVGSTTALGTWSLTFNPDASIVLTSPSGGTTNFTMPPEAVSLFSGPLHAYFGIQPNNPANIGLAATLGRVQIAGLEASSIDETFTTPTVNSDVWQVVAEHAPGVIPVAPDALFWLTWTIPDVNYRLQNNTTLAGGGWSDLALPAVQLGNRKRILVYPTHLPNGAAGNYFFRMTKAPQ
jgi:hypothetical protein